MTINFLRDEYFKNYFPQAGSHLGKKKARLNLVVARTSLFLGIFILGFLYAPSIWYTINGGEKLSEIIARKFEKRTPSVAAPVKETYQPKFDSTLSKEPTISIPAIGVDSVIQEATYEAHEDALKKGIWRVPDFGTPYERSTPTILAAHRFGYLAWTNIFRRKNSFFNLPKLEVGDTVEIVWRQRKYIYEVYKIGEGEEIEDYSADLILYTCEDLNSPVRIFRYARLLEI